MPITPEVLRLAQQYRLQLLARDRAAATRLLYQYGVAWRGLQADIVAAQQRVTVLRAAGVEITEGQVLRIENMVRIRQQVAVEMARYARFADATIVQANREAVAAGQAQAAELLRTSLGGSGIAVVQPMLPRRAVEAMVSLMADGTPLREIIRRIAGDAWSDFSDMMVRGLVAGWNPRELARQLRRSFGGKLTEILRLARTEQLRAYRTATAETYKANERVLNGWMWMAAKDPRTCMACLMMDGTIHSLDEPMVDHPNGRCCAAPITKTYEELGIDAPTTPYQRQTGEEWFREQDEATQRNILGDAKWDAWQEGRFELADIPHKVESEVWGDHWVPSSLQDLLLRGSD